MKKDSKIYIAGHNILNELRNSGLKIFDIRDIKEFICWSRELSANEVSDSKNTKSTKDSIAGAP